MASVIATVLAIPLGALAALKQDTWVDHAIRPFSIGGLALPGFWVGIITILGLLVFFHYLPPLTFTSLFTNPAENLSILIWPALTVGYRYSAVATRMTRSTLLEVIGKLMVDAVAHRDYTMTQALIMLIATTFVINSRTAQTAQSRSLARDGRFGRDVLSRLMYGSRTALKIGFGRP